MKYTITTYDTNGNEIVSRNYAGALGETTFAYMREYYADQIESIIADSEQYLEEQKVDYAEELLGNKE